jgi:hypothetical protein
VAARDARGSLGTVVGAGGEDEVDTRNPDPWMMSEQGERRLRINLDSLF